MDATQREHREHQVKEERKYIRLQGFGLSFWCSILPAMQLACMFGLDVIIGQIAVLLFVVGCAFFFYGMIGREELAKQEKEQTKGDE